MVTTMTITIMTTTDMITGITMATATTIRCPPAAVRLRLPLR
jgi:hypothetical protein